MKKNWASIANEITIATRLAPANVRDLKNEKSTIGTGRCVSMYANASAPTTVATISPTTRVEPQPQRLPSISARKSRGRSDEDRGIAWEVVRAFTVSSRELRAANSVMATAPAATGRFRKKIARHETYSVSAPP